MDGCKGIEPSSSDWKSEIIAIIPTPDIEDIYCPLALPIVFIVLSG